MMRLSRKIKQGRSRLTEAAGVVGVVEEEAEVEDSGVGEDGVEEEVSRPDRLGGNG